MEKRGIVVGPKTDVKEERAKTMRRAMTPAEMCLWEQLRNNRCGGLHFRRQQVIDGFIADFYCHDIGLVIEVDGDIHQQQVDYDFQRDRIIAARGLHIIRIPNERLFTELAVVLSEIQVASRRDQSSD
jgi:very-short-patch-repair endonuclease